MRDVHSHPFLSAMVAPWDRLRDGPVGGWVLTPVVGVLQYLVNDLLTGVLILLVVASLLDWYYGTKTARLKEEYRQERSDWGFQSKVVGVVQMILIRLLEHQGSRLGLIDTEGMLAAALTFILVIRELESIDHHRQRLGGQPIPLLGAVLGLLRRIPDAFVREAKMPIDPPEPPDSGPEAVDG